MKILHISYIEPNAGWGAEYFVDDAFEKLGHTVYKLDYKKNDDRLCEDILAIPDFDVLFLQRGE